MGAWGVSTEVWAEWVGDIGGSLVAHWWHARRPGAGRRHSCQMMKPPSYFPFAQFLRAAAFFPVPAWLVWVSVDSFWLSLRCNLRSTAC